jgi:hypothetical protein
LGNCGEKDTRLKGLVGCGRQGSPDDFGNLLTPLGWGADDRVMKTITEQHEASEGASSLDRRPGLVDLFKTSGGGLDGADAMVKAMLAEQDPLERAGIFAFVRPVLTSEVLGKEGLDVLIAVAEAGIAENLKQAAQEADGDAKTSRLDAANMLSYNLAVDLAFCHEDGFVRERHHFERGVKAAEDCLAWRMQLGKPAPRFALAHWARGVHRLALGDIVGAEEDLERALALSCEGAGIDAAKALDDAAPISVALMRGWVAIVKAFAGEESEKEVIKRVTAILEERFKSGEKDAAEEARRALMELEQGVRKMGLEEGV